MIRRSWHGLVAVALLVATGCEKAAPPTTSAPAMPSAPPATAAVDSLVGAWSRSDTTMEVAIRFLDDGRYRSVEILSYPEADGTYELRRVEDGVADVAGDRLTLTGRSATLTRTSAEHPERDYADRPTPTRTGRYAWHIDGIRLRLVDAEGTAAVFTRQP